MKKIPFLIYITILFMMILSCSKSTGPIQGEVTFITGNLKINTTDASVGSRVSKDDILATGEKSEAVIQISETATITLRSDTEMKFGDLICNSDQSRTVAMELSKGDAYHKIIRKGTDYKVKMPTAVASVRGTSFETSAERSSVNIKVDTGTVYVTKLSGMSSHDSKLTDGQNKGTEEIILTAGESLEIYSDRPDMKDHSGNRSSIAPSGHKKTSVKKEVAPAKYSVSDNQIKSKAPSDKIKPINDEKVAVKKTADSVKEKKPAPEEVKALVDKKDRKLEDIKEVYNRIDSVHLYSGEIITGAIIERGDTYSILTTSGIVKVSRKDIQSNEIIR